MIDTLLDMLVTAAIWIAAVLQLAVARDRGITESRLSGSGRWLVVAGLCGLGARFVFLLADGGNVRVPVESMLSILALSIGCAATALDRLAREPQRRRSTDAMGMQ